ncbi:MAG: menaquinone biosynthesis protein [Chloroflexota bacterium]|nr:menaquinone biosynthesis protein [Chloroflexota bacterium]
MSTNRSVPTDQLIEPGSSGLRVGHMTYLNSEVFYRHLPEESCELVAMPPRAMAAAVDRGDLAAGPLPTAEVFRLGDAVRPLGNLGVASDGSANSVFLFSHLPVDKLNGKRIAVTTHTATSIQLLRVLFADLWNVSGHEFVRTDESHDAALWIGDPALERRSSGQYPYRYDLGRSWKGLTGLPFVFAEWVIRADVPRDRANQLERLVSQATQAGTDFFSVLKISRERATPAMSESDVADYIRAFTYFLGPRERRGQQEFRRRLELLPEWRPPSQENVIVEQAKHEVIPTT